ncbi:MAG: hypothetical protein Q4E20_00100 [Eubacteriales bacterium]|nr:hypothetical protein [Eubacteriales bacterium]
MADRKYSDARKKANQKWDSANLDRLSLALPKGKKDIIKAHAAAQGESVNGFISNAIDNALSPQGGAGDRTGNFTPLVAPEDVAKVNAHIERTGEATSAFISRAISDTIDRDEALLKMGISPARKQK